MTKVMVFDIGGTNCRWAFIENNIDSQKICQRMDGSLVGKMPSPFSKELLHGYQNADDFYARSTHEFLLTRENTVKTIAEIINTEITPDVELIVIALPGNIDKEGNVDWPAFHGKYKDKLGLFPLKSEIEKATQKEVLIMNDLEAAAHYYAPTLLKEMKVIPKDIVGMITLSSAVGMRVIKYTDMGNNYSIQNTRGVGLLPVLCKQDEITDSEKDIQEFYGLKLLQCASGLMGTINVYTSGPGISKYIKQMSSMYPACYKKSILATLINGNTDISHYPYKFAKALDQNCDFSHLIFGRSIKVLTDRLWPVISGKGYQCTKLVLRGGLPFAMKKHYELYLNKTSLQDSFIIGENQNDGLLGGAWGSVKLIDSKIIKTCPENQKFNTKLQDNNDSYRITNKPCMFFSGTNKNEIMESNVEEQNLYSFTKITTYNSIEEYKKKHGGFKSDVDREEVKQQINNSFSKYCIML